MIETNEGLAARIAQLLDDRLERGERENSLVSRLASGAAFEAWLAFESRLLIEQHRHELGLAERVVLDAGHSVNRFWIGNEHRKIDLVIGDNGPDAESPYWLAVEYKLIHNNKNWPSKADEIWADLFPARPEKADVQPKLGRAALVGIIGKVYRDGVKYPRCHPDLNGWESELTNYLLPQDPWNGKNVARVWSGRRFAICDEWYANGYPHFFQLHMLVPA